MKIVTIGGGSGQSELLAHLKDHNLDITAVVSMIDDGGSTGRLREQLQVLPPGDVRRCVAALATANLEFAQLMNMRFADGDLAGHTLGNILLAALEKKGSFANGVKVLSDIVETAGTVVPVSEQPSTLMAELEDGTEVAGEAVIDTGSHVSTARVKRVWLQPEPTATGEAMQAIREADVVVYSIGDLYTSVVPNLLVDGIGQAIEESNATFVYTCNQTSKLTETDGYTALDYVKVLERYSGRSLDYIVVNESNTEPAGDVVSYDAKALKNAGVQVWAKDVAEAGGRTIDGDKLARVLVELCQQL